MKLLEEQDIFKGGRMVYNEEGGTSWVLYTFSHDVVEPCKYDILILAPLGYG